MQLLAFLRFLITLLIKFQKSVNVPKSFFESIQGLFLFDLGLAEVAVLEVLSLV